MQEVRFSLRLLGKNPVLNMVALVCLAAGIGAATAVFSLVDTLLLRPVPAVRAPEELVRLFSVSTRKPDELLPLSWANYLDYARRGELATLASMAPCDLSLTQGGPAERVSGLAVSGTYFSVLGLKPGLGRFFSSNEESEPIAILGYDLWRRRFGADAGVVGKKIVLNGKDLTVVGVAPEGFSGVDLSTRREVWLPLGAYSSIAKGVLVPLTGRQDRQQEWLEVVGRLSPGVSLQKARSGFEVVARNLAASFPEAAERGVRLLPLREVALGVGQRPAVKSFTVRLMAAVSLALFVAVINLAGLLLARALARRREIGIRVSLGCGRGRLARQFLTEGLVLGLLGALAGLLLARMGLPLVGRLQVPAELAARDLVLSGRVVGFAFLAAMACGLVFALAPILQTVRFDAARSLSNVSLPQRLRGVGPREILVACQVALAFLSLLAAGLMMRTASRLAAIDPGFDPKDVLVASVDLSSAGYEGARVATFYGQLLERVRHLPEVADATMASALPVMGGGVMVDLSVTVDEPAPAAGQAADDRENSMRHVLVGEHYMRTVRARLLRGRDFSAADQATAPAVVIVNETAAKQLWGNSDPLGKRIRLLQCEEPFEVIGVVADTTYSSLKESRVPVVYLSHAQAEKSFVGQILAPEMTLLVRTRGRKPGDVLPAFRETVRALDPRLPVFRVSTLEDSLAATVGTERQALLLYSFLGVVTIGLAMLGLYGALAHTVAARTREIGIRVACGADPWAVRRLILRYCAVLAGSGLALGLVLGAPLSRLLADQLFGVAPGDVLTWSVTAVTLLGIALGIGVASSNNAARINPLAALRYE